MRCEEIERFDAARARTLRALFEAEGSMSDKKIAPRAYCAGRRRHYRVAHHGWQPAQRPTSTSASRPTSTAPR
jgi:hypothetical protein